MIIILRNTIHNDRFLTDTDRYVVGILSLRVILTRSTLRVLRPHKCGADVQCSVFKVINDDISRCHKKLLAQGGYYFRPNRYYELVPVDESLSKSVNLTFGAIKRPQQPVLSVCTNNMGVS